MAWKGGGRLPLAAARGPGEGGQAGGQADRQAGRQEAGVEGLGVGCLFHIGAG